MGIVRRDPLIARLKQAVEHNLVDRLAIDRPIERLPHFRGLAERALGLVLADVQRNALVAELDRGGKF